MKYLVWAGALLFALVFWLLMGAMAGRYIPWLRSLLSC